MTQMEMDGSFYFVSVCPFTYGARSLVCVCVCVCVCVRVRVCKIAEGSPAHWEPRLMRAEIQEPQASTEATLSRMTGALLEDSGWYQVRLRVRKPCASRFTVSFFVSNAYSFT
jgi:hypothetical protein